MAQSVLAHRIHRNLNSTPIETSRVIGASAPEPFYRRLLDAAPDAMIVVDADGLIALVNWRRRRCSAMPGPRCWADPSKPCCRSVFARDMSSIAPGMLRQPRIRPMGTGMELAGLRADGSEFPVEITLSPIGMEEGWFVASAIRDVTERQRIEQALTDARNVADRAQKANSAFLVAASHDLRQPVQALSLLVGALKRTVTDPLTLEIVASQQESVDGMTNLLNSLLDVSRLDVGVFEPNVEEFPVHSLLDRFAAEWTRQARHKKLTLSVVPGEASIRSDPDLLAEILQNLVSNALRYTEAGTVRVSASTEGDWVAISVSDTGIGIDPDRLEDVFKEFYQIRDPGRKREGFGLGLAITRRLADLLGHTIRVESRPGVGSTFAVLVPRAAPGMIEHPGDAEPDVGVGTRPALIMLIEDDEYVTAGWQLLLRAEGYRVVVADSYDSARKVAAGLDEAPELIISDYHLADGPNGVQAVIALRADFGDPVPVYVVTGDTSKIVREVSSLENAA